MVAHLASDVKVHGLKPGVNCHVVFLDNKLYSTLFLSTQVYKWVPATKCWGHPVMD